MAATLDHLSDGRFELGMGAGWNFMESDAYGMPLGTLRERSARFEEGMEVIVSLLNNTTTSFAGDYYQLEDAYCEPKAVQAKIPVVIGGKGRVRTLRTLARFADQWDMTFPETPAEWTELDEVLRSHCDRVGRDQSEVARSVHLGFDETDEPTALADKADGFFEAGVDIVVWSMRGAMDASRLGPLASALR